MSVNFNPETFAQEIRDAYRASGKTMQGRIGLTPDVKTAIESAAKEVCSHYDWVAPDQAQGLLIRFEEMGRRNGYGVEGEHRNEILRYLLTEWEKNIQSFMTRDWETKPTDFMPVTAYQGAIIPDLIKDFNEFSDVPWIYKRVAENNPANPRGVLQNIRDVIVKMTANPAFAELADSRAWIFRHAAVNSAKDPEAAVRRALASAKKIQQEDEYSGMAIGHLTLATLCCPKNPRAAAKRVRAKGRETVPVPV